MSFIVTVSIGVLATLPIAPLGAAVNDQPSVGSVEWVAEQIEQSQRFELPREVHAIWRDELHRAMTDSERHAAEQRVQDHPDHPERIQLQFERRRLTEGPDIWVGELLYRDPVHWRISQTTEHLSTFADMALDGNTAWQLTPEQVQLLPSANPPRGFDPESRQGRFEAMLRQFVFGPFLVRTSGEYEVEYADFGEGGSWQSRVVLAGTASVIQLTGRMDGDTLVVKKRVDVRDGRIVHTAEYAEPIWNEYLRRWIFPVYSRIGEDGRLSRRYALTKLEPLDAQVFRRAIRVPRTGADDAIRGSIDATQTIDYRSGAPVIREMSGEAEVEDAVRTTKTAPKPSSAAPLRVIGWMAGSTLVLSGLILWWKRRSNM